MALGLSAAKDYFLTGLKALIPLELVDKIIRIALICLINIDDVTSMSVSQEFAKVVSSRSKTVRNVAGKPLGDISNQNSIR